MKVLLSTFLVIVLLSSCGSKLYSYRKTVKVKEATVAGTPNNTVKVYLTITPEKAGLVKATKTSAVAVDPNSIYLTTKPVPNKKVEKTLSSTHPTSSAMVR